MTGTDAPKSKTSWIETLTVYLQWPILQVFLLGIASGFPLLLTSSTLSARLFESGIDIKTIGILLSVSIPYSLKFLVAPLFDAVHLPGIKTHLGHRKAWLIIIQIGLAMLLFGMAYVDPAQNILALAILALLVACFSASQDIIIDALRIEALKKADQGAGAAANVAGYRIGMFIVGAGSFVVAEFISWEAAYMAAAVMAVCCIGITLSFKKLRGYDERIAEERHNKIIAMSNEDDDAFGENVDLDDTVQNADIPKYKSINEFLYTAILEPFSEFFKRSGAWIILLFIVLFKLGDAMAGSLSSVFYLDIGFTKLEIAAIQKGMGVVAVLAGTFVGGFVVKRMPIYKALLFCGILQILSNFVFVWLDQAGSNLSILSVAIIVENVTGGMGTAAFVAYMSQLCNVKFTATQYALLSSLSSIGRIFFSTTAGFLQAINGWSTFFVISAAFGVPGMCMLVVLRRSEQKRLARQPQDEKKAAEKALDFIQ